LGKRKGQDFVKKRKIAGKEVFPPEGAEDVHPRGREERSRVVWGRGGR